MICPLSESLLTITFISMHGEEVNHSLLVIDLHLSLICGYALLARLSKLAARHFGHILDLISNYRVLSMDCGFCCHSQITARAKGASKTKEWDSEGGNLNQDAPLFLHDAFDEITGLLH